MHDAIYKTRTGLYIAGGLLAANVMSSVLQSQIFNSQSFTDNLVFHAAIDTGCILPICSAYYLIKHM